MPGSLEGVLASIPGYGGYLAKKQYNEQRESQDLEQAVKVQGILSALQQQQMLSGANMNDPDTLRKLGMALKKPEFITHAERIEKQRQEGATLATMQSRPGVQPDPQEVAQAADHGTPAPVARPQGGLFGTLSQSEIPSIAAQARMLQARMDQPDARSVSPQHWVDMQKELAGQETKYLEARQSADNKPEPGVQTHTDGSGRLWERERGGSWKIALGPDKKPITSLGGPNDATQPTKDTLEMDAWRYLTDGTLPTNMGRGVQGSAQATAIRNRSAALAKEMGMSPDEIRMAQLTNKTQVQAIGQLAKAKAQILQFEKTASMNAELALQASEKVDRTGIPVLNRWVQAGRTSIAGDVEAQKFHAATETFVSEYAKVMSGGYGAAATTEGAQNRAHSLLNTANTKEQFRGVVGQLKAEMDNRVKALNSQMDEEKGNLRRGIKPPAPTPTPAPTGGKQRIKFDAQGNQVQ